MVSRRRATIGPDGEDGTVHLTAPQALEGTAGVGGSFDDDCRDRLAGTGLERRLVAVVHLDHVQQGAHHARNSREMTRAGPRTCGIECRFEGLDTCH